METEGIRRRRQRRAEMEQTNFRTTPALKERLERSAAANGVSFNREINERLERSFLDDAQADGQVERFAASADTVAILCAVAAAMEVAGAAAKGIAMLSSKDADWHDDPFSYDQAVSAARQMMDALRPAGEIKPPAAFHGMAGDLDMTALGQNLGILIANGLIAEIASEDPISTASIDRAPKLRNALDRFVDRVRNFARPKK